MIKEIVTFDQMHDQLNSSGHPCCYWGEHGDWLVAMGRHRDSDILTNCNWDVFKKMLDTCGEDAYIVENESHWAVGWVEHILINPANEAAMKMADDVEKQLNDYPVLDDEAFSQAEQEELHSDWANWGKRECINALQEFWALSDRAIAAIESYDQLLYWFCEKNGEDSLNDITNTIMELETTDVASLVWQAKDVIM